MNKKTFQEIDALYEEWLLTLDDTSRDDWYCTDRGSSANVWSHFVQWLVNNKKIRGMKKQ
jgi:hypothetical protein